MILNKIANENLRSSDAFDMKGKMWNLHPKTFNQWSFVGIFLALMLTKGTCDFNSHC